MRTNPPICEARAKSAGFPADGMAGESFRLDRVCQLLAESDLSLVDVAGIAGFDHPEYMSRLFRKKMGITPGKFRKQAGPGRLPVL